MPTVSDVVRYLKRFAPLDLAAEWDNVGLLLGDGRAPVRRILTCLTLTAEVVDEAIASGVGLIVTHHPVLFRATQKLSSEQRDGQLLLPLLKADIAVYSPHTAFDNTIGGINDMLATRLGLIDVEPLRRKEAKASTCKLVVFVPEAEVETLSAALFEAGAGRIGDYRECSFRIPGTGTFHGGESTKPTIGQKGQREEVAELRFEVICPESALSAVIAALRRTHSYEEPAFDIYPLKSVPRIGEGRIGRLPQPLTLRKFVARVKKQLQVDTVEIVGDPTREVTKVALACGAAGEFLHDAQRQHADLFLTGEMRFHDYLSAQSQKIALVLPGHYATERFALEELALLLGKEFPDVSASASMREQSPSTWL